MLPMRSGAGLRVGLSGGLCLFALLTTLIGAVVAVRFSTVGDQASMGAKLAGVMLRAFGQAPYSLLGWAALLSVGLAALVTVGSWLIRESSGQAAAVFRLLAAGMLAVSAGRFAYVSTVQAIERAPKALLGASGAPSADRVLREIEGADPAPSASAAAIDAGSPIRVVLAVLDGKERSEVYANGVRVGQTPLISDVSCKVGEIVRIEIVPPRGVPRTRSYRCSPGEIRVRD
jgi:hypothetical protein